VSWVGLATFSGLEVVLAPFLGALEVVSAITLIPLAIDRQEVLTHKHSTPFVRSVNATSNSNLSPRLNALPSLC